MSIPMGLVAVWPDGSLARDRVEPVLARAMGLDAPLPRLWPGAGGADTADTADAGPSGDVPGGVLDAGAWLPDGVLALFHNPMGYDVMRLHWSPNALCESNALTEQRMDSIERVARATLDELHPAFGYLSHYGDHLDDNWLEQRVLVSLLAEDWDDTISPLYHLVLLPPALPARPPDHGRVIHASSAGRIVRLGPHRSPFGPLAR